MTQEGLLCSVHGIDGTGKTTAVENTAKHLSDLGFQVVNFDIEKDLTTYPLNPYKKVEEGELLNICESYFQSMQHHSQQIEKLVSQGKIVIKARYFDDIRAHFSHLGMTESILKEYEDIYQIVNPSIKIILSLDETTRRFRINERGVLDDFDKDSCKEGTRLGNFHKYLLEKTTGNTLFIDTKENPPQNVARTISTHIQKLINH